MRLSDNEIKLLYDKAARYPAFLHLDALLGRATEHSIYRKKAIALLKLTPNSTVLDVACGIGFNFKIIESYLQNSGKLIGIDISSESLKVAKGYVVKHGWTNVELVNTSITDYNPDIQFDAILCTYALEIISDYKAAIDNIYRLLKPQGRFAMIGMKLSSRLPYKLINPFINWLYKSGGIDVHRDIIGYIKSKFKKIDYYENCFFDFDYILSASKLYST
ncbi:MAG: class I SAM-dependent methyltransferase [Candidatus Asgardarchaeia archaeon]